MRFNLYPIHWVANPHLEPGAFDDNLRPSISRRVCELSPLPTDSGLTRSTSTGGVWEKT
jgi:hypothetical protein